MKVAYEIIGHLLFEKYKIWEQSGFDPEYREAIITEIKDNIFNLPNIFRGYSSKEVQFMSTSEKGVVKDHVYSRVQSAERALELIQKGILTEDRIVPFLMSRCRVCYVWKDQNRAMSIKRGSPFIHPKTKYRQHGVELVPWKGAQK